MGLSELCRSGLLTAYVCARYFFLAFCSVSCDGLLTPPSRPPPLPSDIHLCAKSRAPTRPSSSTPSCSSRLARRSSAVGRTIELKQVCACVCRFLTFIRGETICIVFAMITLIN
jgi:hypothetical protein